METSDWAIVISLLSFGVALGSLAWNVWSKFIFPKPKFRVGAAVVLLVDLGQAGEAPKLIRLSATNHGPIPGKLSNAILKLKQADGTVTFGLPRLLVAPFASDAVDVGAGYPASVGIGDTHDSYLPFAEDSVFRRGVFRIGVGDSFGRNHWARPRDVKAIVKTLRESYPDAWTPTALAGVAMTSRRKRPRWRKWLDRLVP